MINTMIRYAWLFACLTLAGCQLGNPGTTTPLPQGSITGLVVNGGPVAGASVTIYGPAGVVASTRTDDNGNFSIPLQMLSGQITVIVSNGSYGEIATGTTEQSGTLRGDFSYQQGASLDVAVTPLTTVADALATFLESQGVSSSVADLQADQDLADWLGFKPSVTQPLLLTAVTGSHPFDSSLRYGLVIAALSQWAHSVGATTTAALTATLVADVEHDGLLNGQGSQGALSLASLPLSPTAYRQGIAAALVQAAASQPAGTPAALPGPNAQLITAYAQTTANAASALFGATAPPAPVSAPLTLSINPVPPWTHGQFLLGGLVTDTFALPVSIAVAIDGHTYQTITAASHFAVAINTGALSDGAHTLSLVAQDATGATATAGASLEVDNTPPQACLALFQSLTSSIFVSGHWQDISGVVSGTLNGTPVNISPSGVWYVALASITQNPITLVLNDNAGNSGTFSWPANPQSNASCQ